MARRDYTSIVLYYVYKDHVTKDYDYQNRGLET